MAFGSGVVFCLALRAMAAVTSGHAKATARGDGRAGLPRAQPGRGTRGWPWGSAAVRNPGPPAWLPQPEEWSSPFPLDWGRYVEEPQDAEEESPVQAAIARSRASGDDDWVKQTTARLGLGRPLRPNGRPRSAREVS
jgi:hypothetical protein